MLRLQAASLFRNIRVFSPLRSLRPLSSSLLVTEKRSLPIANSRDQQYEDSGSEGDRRHLRTTAPYENIVNAREAEMINAPRNHSASIPPGTVGLGIEDPDELIEKESSGGGRHGAEQSQASKSGVGLEVEDNETVLEAEEMEAEEMRDGGGSSTAEAEGAEDKDARGGLNGMV